MIFTEKRLCWSKAFNFIKKDTPTQVFSCKYCEIFKNTYFEEYLQTATSRITRKRQKALDLYICVSPIFLIRLDMRLDRTIQKSIHQSKDKKNETLKIL